MNNHFLAHIIRDIFPNRNFTIIYGEDRGLQTVLATAEHSIGAFQLHTERDQDQDSFQYKFWEIGLDDPCLAYGDADLFISINYNPLTYDSNTEAIAFQIKSLLKPGGKALIINPGTWAKDFNRILQIDEFATREMMRYSMLQNESVLVYENI
jgi:ribosomal protein RSM22 (predicted rRNA methylase)